MTHDITYIDLALDMITASLTNPRKHFDQDKLSELSASIKSTGVHTPVLVRPLPAYRLEDSAHMKPRPTHELVVGERRYRASALAEVKTIPAIVRELTDDQVLEIQVTENLQRDDLTELEEAEGYQLLMERARVTPEVIAEKVGKSRSYVYGRLKLLDLCIEGREALRKGDIDASKGLLIARIPDTALQVKALKDIGHQDYHGVMSYRRAAELVQDRYMLKLSGAGFRTTDATLVPDVGACKACPKRTGANPDLFADIKGADMCLDPTCFASKERAHKDATLRAARDRGATILEGREAKALMPSQYDSRIEGYRRLDDKSDSPTDQTLRKLIGKVMVERGVQEVLLANPHKDDELIACLPVETVTELLQAAAEDTKNTKASEAAASVARETQREKDWAAQKAKEKAKSDYESAWRWQLLETTWEAIETGTLDPQPEVMRHLAHGLAKRLNQDQCKRLCKLLELGKVAPKEGLLDWVKDITNPYMALQLLVMHADVEYRSWLPDDRDANEGLLLVAKAYDVTPESAQDVVKKAVRAATKAAKAQKVAQGNDEPNSKRNSGAKNPVKRNSPKPKLSAEEAQRGIATAMQGEESAEVRPSDNHKDSEWPYPASKEVA